MSASDLSERLDAVERALTDGDADLAGIREATALAEDVERLEERIDDLEATVEELDAALEAVRGYAGNVRAVNRDVERRASAALAKAEALEAAVDRDGVDALAADAGRPHGSTEAGEHEHRTAAGEHERAGTTDARSGAGSVDPTPADGRGDRATGRVGDCGRRACQHDGAIADDASRPGRGSTGADERATGERERAGTAVDDRSEHGRPADRSPDVDGDDWVQGSTDAGTDDEETETEQFIERVRDAL